MKHLTTDEIETNLTYILEAPKESGILKMIVVRPDTNERKILETCQIKQEYGVEGDNWPNCQWKTLPNGDPHPDVQVSLTSYRMLKVLGENDEHRALSGDNLHVDFDISPENLSVGDQLSIGTVIIEITDVLHVACGKYLERFGKDAAAFINSKKGKEHRLRGTFAKIIRDGKITKNDKIEKVLT
ncbi:MAG: MOSC domain-containing protein [Lentisphaeria bacterium]|nr:MOSC domain-containing protein [Lentisphaeria bacterium]NQZ67818.1 MOSC domain-containing protein [Lentisphaeria bacterium]